MRKTLFLLCIVFSFQAIGQIESAQLKQISEDISYLASDELEGRKTGSEGEALAATYIARRFEEIGLAPKGTEDTWFHNYNFKEKAHPHEEVPSGKEINSKNVVGYLDKNANLTIIIGAHYDHLGHGGQGSLSTENEIHNGADDNASGVAALILLAEQLSASEALSYNVLFIAFSGEELGLFGSKMFTQNPTIELSKVDFMINMDMVGRLTEESGLQIFGVGTSPVWNDIINQIKVDGIDKVRTKEDGIGPSDHTSFYLMDIPVLHFFTGQHADYHKPSDDTEKINFEGILAISQYIEKVIEKTDPAEKLAFTKTKSTQKKAASFKVSLGIMPDYMFKGPGLKVDGVLEDRPAEKAGLAKGDIIMFMDDREIADIYAYMEGLASYNVGDKCLLKVVRGEEELELEVGF